jgi:hypothetical protein
MDIFETIGMKSKEVKSHGLGQFIACILIMILGLTILYGCEGYNCGEGIVYDSKTKLPLDSVLCISNGGDKIYTDTTGKFNLCGPFGGCVNGCPKLEIDFTKKGYKSQKITKEFKSIYLEKE